MTELCVLNVYPVCESGSYQRLCSVSGLHSLLIDYQSTKLHSLFDSFMTGEDNDDPMTYVHVSADALWTYLPIDVSILTWQQKSNCE